MNVIGEATALYTVAGKDVVDVRADTRAPGYVVGPCEISDAVTGVAVGDRLVLIPAGAGDEQYVVVARLP